MNSNALPERTFSSISCTKIYYIRFERFKAPFLWYLCCILNLEPIFLILTGLCLSFRQQRNRVKAAWQKTHSPTIVSGYDTDN